MSEQNQVKSRPSELTAVLNREFFEQPPEVCVSPQDINRWKSFRKKYHLAHELKYRSDFPLQIDFELNSHCNMKCSFCTHGNETVPVKKMNFETFKKTIDEGEKHGLVSIKLNYINEPLLRSDIWDFIKYARSKGILNIYFSTNGTKLTESNSIKLIESGVSKIMVSLDAVTPETFRLMRHSERFEEIIENVERFIRIRNSMGKTNPLLRVNFVKTDLNIHESDTFITFWKDKADALGFQDLVSVPGVKNKNTKPHKRNFRCSFPFKLSVVDVNGDVLPCCPFSGREMPIGAVRSTEANIKTAWESKRRQDLINLHERGGYEENPICKHCINSGGV